MSSLSSRPRGIGAGTLPDDRPLLMRAWLVIALVVAVDALGLRWLPAAPAVTGGWRAAAGVCGLSVVAAVLAWRVRKGDSASRWHTQLADLSYTVQWMIVFAVFCRAAGVLSYLSVATRFPLIDAELIRLDRAVGFDWAMWYRWVGAHRPVFVVFSLAYASGVVQTIGIPLFLGVSRRRSEMSRHIVRMMAVTLITIGVSTPLPATGAFLYFHVTDPGAASTVADFLPLRAGTLAAIDLTDLQGLVSMPSMHVAMAILFVWSMRRVPRLAAPTLALNVVMIMSTPSHGGHYLSDLIAGAVLAGVVIWFSRERLR